MKRLFFCGEIKFKIKEFTIEIYWPRIVYNNVTVGIIAKSVILFKGSNKWSKNEPNWSIAIVFLGFGGGCSLTTGETT